MEKRENPGIIHHPIPRNLPDVAGWKEVYIEESQEPLIALGMFSGYPDIFTDSIYFAERADSPYVGTHKLEGSLITTFVRESVADQLRLAQSFLPNGLHLVVFDGWRPLEVQKSLYDQFYRELKNKYSDWDKEKLSIETQKYVSLPSDDPKRPSPHNTGGTVDLAMFRLPSTAETSYQELIGEIREKRLPASYGLEMRKDLLIRKNGQFLNFGTVFDYGGVEASLNYYEKLTQLNIHQLEARNNRRILYNSMILAGFEAYPDEWWHYNSRQTQMGAKAAGHMKARMGAADFTPTNFVVEEYRRWLLKKPLYRDIKYINFPLAEAIKPV